MTTYEKLKKFNNENKEKLDSFLMRYYKDIDDIKFKKLTLNARVYRLVKENGNYYLVNNLDKDKRFRTNKILLKKNDPCDLYYFLYHLEYNYIINFSELKNYINSWKFVTVDKLLFDNLFCFNTTNLEKLYIIKVDNLDNFVGKKILQGFNVVYDYYDLIKVLSNGFICYVVSQYSIKLNSVDDFTYFNLRIPTINYLYINNIDVIGIKKLDGFLQGNYNLKEAYFENFNTSNIISLHGFFYDCPNLRKVNIESFNTAKVEIFDSMFENCSSLKELNLNNWDMQSALSLYAMFRNASSLECLYIDKWETPNLASMKLMCDNCKLLVLIDISGIQKSSKKNLNMDHWNYHCDNLKEY